MTKTSRSILSFDPERVWFYINSRNHIMSNSHTFYGILEQAGDTWRVRGLTIGFFNGVSGKTREEALTSCILAFFPDNSPEDVKIRPNPTKREKPRRSETAEARFLWREKALPG